MAIEIVCGTCARQYRVDPKYAGKKIRCKHCNALMLVINPAPAASTPASTPATNQSTVADQIPLVQDLDTIPLDESESQPAAIQSSAATPVVAPPAIREEVPKLPELPDESLAAVARPSPIEVCCPSCGNPFPPNNRLCLNCGYERSSGARLQTVTAAIIRPAPQAAPRAKRPRAYRGVRRWEPYDNGFVNFLDTYVPKFVLILFVLFIIGSIATYIAFSPRSRGIFAVANALFLVWCIVGVALYYFGVLNIAMAGVRTAGGLMRFEVPEEDGKNRLLTAHVVAWIPATFVYFIGIIAANVHTSGSLAPRPEGLMIIAFSVVLYIAIAFSMFMLLFHLRFVESVVGFLMMLLFHHVGMIVCGALLFGFVWVTAMIFLSVAKATM